MRVGVALKESFDGVTIFWHLFWCSCNFFLNCYPKSVIKTSSHSRWSVNISLVEDPFSKMFQIVFKFVTDLLTRLACGRREEAEGALRFSVLLEPSFLRVRPFEGTDREIASHSTGPWHKQMLTCYMLHDSKGDIVVSSMWTSESNGGLESNERYCKGVSPLLQMVGLYI